jgi:exopolysaccharide biosynthesis predicted pyruvyltransferase EpsI/glycosyltransferase involved in cell wall biosynthesis
MKNKFCLIDDYIQKFGYSIFQLTSITDKKIQKSVVSYVSYVLTGSYDSVYNFGLLQKMFKPGYNLTLEFSWIMSKEEANKGNDVKIDDSTQVSNLKKLHGEYYRKLWRHAELEVALKYKGQYLHINSSMEFKYIQYYKNYLASGYQVSLTRTFDELLYQYYKTFFYLPKTKDMKTIVELVQNNINVLDIVNNDSIYLSNCKQHFSLLASSGNGVSVPTVDSPTIKKLKYYGPVGTSGYAKITRNIIESLYNQGIDIEFDIIQFHNYSEESISDTDFILSKLYNNKLSNYDHVVLHSTPEIWTIISKYEKQKNPNCIIYGISVWELDVLPLKWNIYINYVDKISVPSNFSAISFKKECLLQTIDVIHHPIIPIKTLESVRCMMYDKKQEYDYIFYNISEWTNRKGVTELIKSFIELKSLDSLVNFKIALYIKTFGDISKEDAIKHFGNMDDIFLDYARVSDSYIECIHNCANCYISLTKSEGHGIGLCEAVLADNHIIVTDYGGQLDYLKYPDVIKITEFEPATLCSTWSKKHKICRLLPCCKSFDGFIPSAGHKWACVEASLKDAVKFMEQSVLMSKKGNPLNKKFIQHEFNLESFGNKLVKSILDTKNLPFDYTSTIKKINYLDTISDELLAPQLLHLKYEERKKKIIILSCYGSGNVGDDIIGEILKTYFGKYDIRTCMDNSVLLNTGNLVPLDQFEHVSLHNNLWDFDYMIIGGGGIFRSSNKFSSIQFYYNICKRKNIPYFIVGTGFQDIELDTSVDDFKSKFKSLSNLFNHAEIISMRSIIDFSLCKNLLLEKNIPKLHYFPDIAYSMLKVLEPIYKSPLEQAQRNIFMVILTKNWINLSKTYIVDYIRKHSVGLQLVFINFGGWKEKVDFELAKKLFPSSLIYYGKHTEYEIDPTFNSFTENRTLTLFQIWNLLLNTKFVITGRYHGIVLAKIAKIEHVETFDYNNFKFKADTLSNHQLMSADQLAKLAFVPLQMIETFIANDTSCSTFFDWDDDQRNSSIIKCNEINNIDISILQNWNNRQLEQYILSFS